MKEEERIRCPIHDLISFKKSRSEDELLWALLQTPAVQRLRRIKQLGFTEFVYPGASHTRLSHVLGAMQMARRMLDVFEKNDVMREVDDYETERRATLAAALLHDIGHGPYSHVFEELCADIGLEKDHETYTKELLDLPEINSLLEEFGVAAQTKRFFEEEPGYSVFNAIISSQLDCDRLDFLCRDRYYTGIRSAAIDLAWLFDSLRIEDVIADDEGTRAYAFVFQEKGLAVAEEFVIAYMKMYENVYFHKTTRGVQHLVKEFLEDVYNNRPNDPLLRDTKLATFWQENGDLSHYLKLDDSSILSLIHVASQQEWGLSTTLAERFLNRDVYKCFELPRTEAGNIGRNKLDRFREALRSEGIHFIEDILSHRSYKQHAVTDPNFLKNILIKKGGEHESLGAVSRLLKEPTPRVARLYFRNQTDCEKAQEIFRAL